MHEFAEQTLKYVERTHELVKHLHEFAEQTHTFAQPLDTFAEHTHEFAKHINEYVVHLENADVWKNWMVYLMFEFSSPSQTYRSGQINYHSQYNNLSDNI